MADERLGQTEYNTFRKFLSDACGIVLGDNKHYLVVSRLNRMARDAGLPTISALLAKLPHDRELARQAVEAMTTNETSWFRDQHPFNSLRDHILPELARRGTAIRLWSAACSSGQEPYSLSMMIDESLRTHSGLSLANVQIIATDVSKQILDEARTGSYDGFSMMRGLTDDQRQRYFVSKGDRWEITPRVKGRVSFREYNLMQSYASLGRFDVIFCRNVLIYFSATAKEDILRRLAQALNPGGYLFLGAAETASSASDLLDLVRFNPGSAYKRR
ncbi:chemotaxis protein [Acidihalobacter yilgarnensis]|uniref:protein-glutamate O-methyltransferase n=1 Tax=Acidihalobacter yilgarnensis TaxID=2819280 RepID=A0A1D8IPR8_9GAMM|nr:protein-glutamate O-methyltransferase CheR [Acidihalobacter yilgarnensis]AOU98439.1 chemotaxis protein [Acidihalobacter yilgarnensis]